MFPLYDTIRARSLPLANWLLIGLNIVVFVYELSLGPQVEELIVARGLVPARFLDGPAAGDVLTLGSSLFLHAGWAHLASNLWALWIFGDNVEDRFGSGRYLLFYLVCGLAAAAAHIAFNPESSLPTIGASGAIAGVLGAYILLFPRARVFTLVPLFFIPWFIEIPALFYLGIWFLSQLLNGALALTATAEAAGGVAWWAHAGGFLAGLLLAALFARRAVRRVYRDDYWPW